MKKFIASTLTAVVALTEALPVLTTVAIATATLAPTESQALPADRAAGRQNARGSRQSGRAGAQDSRQSGRQTSRARRRGYYGLPAGAAPYAYGGYNYYRAGGRYYYPYMYGGRTVYIDVDVSGGRPMPPPPVGSIDIDIY